MNVLEIAELGFAGEKHLSEAVGSMENTIGLG